MPPDLAQAQVLEPLEAGQQKLAKHQEQSVSVSRSRSKGNPLHYCSPILARPPVKVSHLQGTQSSILLQVHSTFTFILVDL